MPHNFLGLDVSYTYLNKQPSRPSQIDLNPHLPRYQFHTL